MKTTAFFTKEDFFMMMINTNLLTVTLILNECSADLHYRIQRKTKSNFQSNSKNQK